MDRWASQVTPPVVKAATTVMTSSTAASPAVALLSTTRSWLRQQVEDGFPTVARFQEFFGAGRKRDFLNFISHDSSTPTPTMAHPVQQKKLLNGAPIYKEKTASREASQHEGPRKQQSGGDRVGWVRSVFYLVSDIYFRAASVLGEEVTFVLLLPFLWWHFVTELAESVVFLWCFSCYVGHMLKDLLQLPRPYANTVVRLEHHHECEYGLPSTHAIAATTLPLCIAFHCYNYGLFDPLVYVPLGVLFWLSVCLSRIYLGVHSPADLFWGTVVGVACFYLWINVSERVDLLLDTSSLQIMLTMPAILSGLLIVYPAPSQWTSSYGDTATILGALNGGLLHLGLFGKRNPYRLDFNELIDGQTFYWALARIVVGYLIVFMTRLIMKTISYTVLSSLPIKYSGDSAKQRYAMEIPAKFINYSLVCLSATACAPLAMHMLFS